MTGEAKSYVPAGRMNKLELAVWTPDPALDVLIAAPPGVADTVKSLALGART